MSISLVNTLKPIALNIEQLYLDPNNPRFLSPDWEYISEDKITSEFIQHKTLDVMINNYGIDKLAANIRLNGFLKMDRIVVRKIVLVADKETEKNDIERFVVLEGNRRLAAIKVIHQQLKANSTIDADVLSSINEIECLEYIGSNSEAAWIFQGLRHISGITDWPPFNKAKLLVDQMNSENLTLTQVGERFGISPFAAGQWMRGYKAYEQSSNESDYIQELDMNIYPYLQEIFGRSSIGLRDWLEWDEKEMQFKNKLNLNEFIGWLYPKDSDNTDAFGNWEKRHLDGRDDLRTISYLITQAPKHFDEFRRELKLENAYAKALASKHEDKMLDATEQTFISLTKCIQALNNVPAKAIGNTTTKDALIDKCSELISIINELLPEAIKNGIK
ncbi:hypothetical protein BH11BAC3_BH11BAC3_06770 [soil metagenome]